MYYLTVGYPLGMEIIENRLVYQVSLRSRCYPLIPLEQRIWQRFLLGAYDDDVRKGLSEMDRDGYQISMNKFIMTGLLQGITEPGFPELESLIFMRQGIGVGRNLERNVHTVLFRQEVEVSELEYKVWSLADGNITYGELERKIQGFDMAKIRETVIRLCRKGMILAVNREER